MRANQIGAQGMDGADPRARQQKLLCTKPLVLRVFSNAFGKLLRNAAAHLLGGGGGEGYYDKAIRAYRIIARQKTHRTFGQDRCFPAARRCRDQNRAALRVNCGARFR